jgi:hypothetical protein
VVREIDADGFKLGWRLVVRLRAARSGDGRGPSTMRITSKCQKRRRRKRGRQRHFTVDKKLRRPAMARRRKEASVAARANAKMERVQEKGEGRG